MNVKFKIFVLIAISLSLNFDLFSQWTCRSKLPNHLKPFSKNFPLSWAIESTIGHGYMNDREITNMMMFAGLDYSFGHHQFYFEGATKGWRNTLDKKNDAFLNKRYQGIREGYYKYYNENTNLVIGFQQFLAGEYFLVKERGVGLSYKRNLGRFDIDANISSVLKDYSRFGSFCSVHYLYNVVRDRHYPYLGESFGDSNFASLVIKYTPSKPKREKKSSKEKSEDEFDEFEDFGDESTDDEFADFDDASSDEFAEFDETENTKHPSVLNYFKKKLLYETGFVLYNEFGNGIDTSKIYLGAFADFSLPYEFSLKSEILHQEIENQRALIYHFKLSKFYKWKKGNRTSFAFGYYGKLNYNDEAKAQMSFSNLFIGEVMRLDVYDMPLYQLSMKHNFPKIRLHVKLQAVKQMKDDEISEINLAIGKTFYKSVKLTSMFSKMEANSLSETFYMGRLELRITI